jgi:hypothetical protein
MEPWIRNFSPCDGADTMFLAIAALMCRAAHIIVHRRIDAIHLSWHIGALSTSLAQKQHRLRHLRGVLYTSHFSPREHAALHDRSEVSSSSLMRVAGDVPESLKLPQDYCTLARRVHALYCIQDPANPRLPL